MSSEFIHSKYINNRSIFLLLIQMIIYISPSKIVLPFSTKSYPFDLNNEFQYIFNNEIYTTVEMGTPAQKLDLFLTMKTPLFIIKKNESFPQYYNNKSSSTYKYYVDTRTFYFNDEIIKTGIYSGEKFILQNSFNNNDKEEIFPMDFIYGTEYEEDDKNHVGILGLQFFSTSSQYEKEVNLINLLKKNKKISSYVWNLNYTSDNEGYLIIGEYPHYFNSKQYNKDDLNQINVRQVGAKKVVWNLYFNSIKYGENELNSYRTANFAPQYGVIAAPVSFDRVISEQFFKEYINNQKCKRKTYNDTIDYYVCDEGIDLSKFKDIEFTEKELSPNNFVLTKDDLFLKKNGKLYFLVTFGREWQWQYSWIFGKPFIKKYNFLFDQDGKQILHYIQEGKKVSGVIKKNYLYFIWSGIGVLLIVIAILSYVLLKLIKERKKKLYELEDEFDYNSGESINDNQNKNQKFGDEQENHKFDDEQENKFGINSV